MKEFVFGILTSIIGSIIFTFGAFWFSRKFRKFLYQLTNRLFNTGITNIYESQKFALEDIEKSFYQSNKIKILTYGGSDFYGEKSPNNYFFNKLGIKQKLEFISFHPNPPDKIKYIDIRAKELLRINDIAKLNHYIDNIKNGVDILKELDAKYINIDVRHHNQPPSFKLIIFDNELYLSAATVDKRAVENKTYRYDSNSQIYKIMIRHFDFIFQESDKL